MSERRQHWRAAKRTSVAVGLLLLLGCAQLPQSAPIAAQAATCRMAAEDERWLTGALRNWRIVARDYLEVDAAPLPQVVSYDARCSYAVSARAEGRSWSAAAHEGQIALPNGARIPPAPNASNAVSNESNFVVMSLPSIWQPVAPPSEIPLAWRLEGIMFHELTHAYQAATSPRLSFPQLHSEYALPESVNDDSVQDRFKDNPGYVRAYESERDLLFRAAAASGDRQARVLACQALDLLRKRRADHFTDEEIPWSVVDELSLTTEGLGEWVSYTWLTRGRLLAPAVVLPKFRGSSWSQEQGLAAFLVIDRLVPGWQKLALAPEPETVEPLLARACGR